MLTLDSKDLIDAPAARVLLGCSPSTLRRYARVGVKGRDGQQHILATIKIRTGLYTSRAAVEAFVHARSKLPDLSDRRVARPSMSHEAALNFLHGGPEDEDAA